MHDLVPIMYGAGFEKANIAGATRGLAEAALVTRDPFLISLFREAGAMLGAMARTLAAKRCIEERTDGATPRAGSMVGRSASKAFELPVLSITAVGSVFKSWDLLKEGFEAAAMAPVRVYGPKGGMLWVRLTGARLVQPAVSSAAGAAYLGCKEAGEMLPLDFDSCSTPLGFIGGSSAQVVVGEAVQSSKDTASGAGARWSCVALIATGILAAFATGRSGSA